jgi:plasmid stability protein
MKTTIDLPDALVRQLKLRAVRDGRKFKDLAAELLRVGLAGQPKAAKTPRPVITNDRKTGLPVIQCPRTAPLPPDEVADILTQQEAEWSNVPT